MLARARPCWVLSDEIYSQILYEGEHPRSRRRPGMLERTIILDGFSKTYAMTGWRLGYGVDAGAARRAVTRLLASTATRAPRRSSQLAGVAALTGPQDEVEAMMAEFRRAARPDRRRAERDPRRLVREPHGAFYVFPNITGTGMPARELADRLLDEAGVAVLSGTAFGAYGEGYLRLSYANSHREHPRGARDHGRPARRAMSGAEEGGGRHPGPAPSGTRRAWLQPPPPTSRGSSSPG